MWPGGADVDSQFGQDLSGLGVDAGFGVGADRNGGDLVWRRVLHEALCHHGFAGVADADEQDRWGREGHVAFLLSCGLVR